MLYQSKRDDPTSKFAHKFGITFDFMGFMRLHKVHEIRLTKHSDLKFWLFLEVSFTIMHASQCLIHAPTKSSKSKYPFPLLLETKL